MEFEGPLVWLVLIVPALVVLGFFLRWIMMQPIRETGVREEWLAFANEHNMAFNPGNTSTGPAAEGEYRDYPIAIDTEIVGQPGVHQNIYQRTRYQLSYSSDAPPFAITARRDTVVDMVRKNLWLDPAKNLSAPAQLHEADATFNKSAEIVTEDRVNLDRYLTAERRHAIADLLSRSTITDVMITHDQISVSALGVTATARELDEIVNGLTWYADRLTE